MTEENLNADVEEELEPEHAPTPPQYYADFDDSGNIAGFYVDEIHGNNIPESAIPIDEADWLTYSADAAKFKRDGDVIREKTAEELESERAARPPREPSRVEVLEAENATLWYQLMTEKSRNDNHDSDIAELYHTIMTGGASV